MRALEVDVCDGGGPVVIGNALFEVVEDVEDGGSLGSEVNSFVFTGDEAIREGLETTVVITVVGTCTVDVATTGAGTGAGGAGAGGAGAGGAGAGGEGGGGAGGGAGGGGAGG